MLIPCGVMHAGGGAAVSLPSGRDASGGKPQHPRRTAGGLARIAEKQPCRAASGGRAQPRCRAAAKRVGASPHTPTEPCGRLALRAARLPCGRLALREARLPFGRLGSPREATPLRSAQRHAGGGLGEGEALPQLSQQYVLMRAAQRACPRSSRRAARGGRAQPCCRAAAKRVGARPHTPKEPCGRLALRAARLPCGRLALRAACPAGGSIALRAACPAGGSALPEKQPR